MTASPRHVRDIEPFTTMSGDLGSKQSGRVEACLPEDVFQGRPCLSVPTMADRPTGRAELRAFLERAASDVDPYDAVTGQFCEMADPDCLIAEYTPHTTCLPNGRSYASHCPGIVRGRGDNVAYRRDDVNPPIIEETLRDDFTTMSTSASDARMFEDPACAQS